MTITKTKSKGMLFSGPMVRAILDGKKTMTRRIVKPQDKIQTLENGTVLTSNGWLPELDNPYGQSGDTLYVKETWRIANINPRIPSGQFYTVQFKDWGVLPHPQPDQKLFVPLVAKDKFTTGGIGDEFGRWRSSMFLPRAFSRATLTITAVRAERLQDISDEDVSSEGTDLSNGRGGTIGEAFYLDRFAALWNTINGKTYPWESNPWVWVISFERQ